MERDDGGVVLALRGLERGLFVPAADRLVRAVLQQLRNSGLILLFPLTKSS